MNDQPTNEPRIVQSSTPRQRLWNRINSLASTKRPARMTMMTLQIHRVKPRLGTLGVLSPIS